MNDENQLAQSVKKSIRLASQVEEDISQSVYEIARDIVKHALKRKNASSQKIDKIVHSVMKDVMYAAKEANLRFLEIVTPAIEGIIDGSKVAGKKAEFTAKIVTDRYLRSMNKQ